jgi:RimJ/RimL family protein N-acetyltransferase
MEFRAYREDEFDFACALRSISDDEKKQAHRERFEAVGQWRDHYLDYAIDVDGQVIGEVQIRRCNKTMPPGVLAFGIEIAPEFQGRGYGTQATILISELMFSEGNHRISGDTDTLNIAMQKTFEKAGWTHEGTMRALFVEDGIPHDYLTYSFTSFQSQRESGL